TGTYWEWVDGAVEQAILNFRSGKFSRQLPIARWWQDWKKPAYVAAAAYVIAIAASSSQYLQAKSEHRAIIGEMNTIYREAVPNGRPGDPEGALRSMVRGLEGGADASNLMYILDGVSSALANK